MIVVSLIGTAAMAQKVKSNSKDTTQAYRANIPEWKKAVKNVMRKYPSAEFVIPGHFGWGSRDALKHTLKLIEKHQEENK